MCNILIFGGTSDGRRLGEDLRDLGYHITFSVATDYGSSFIKEEDKVRVERGRKSSREIMRLLKDHQQQLVVDATHPYAEQARKEILAACSGAGTPYYRLVRDPSPKGYGRYVDSPLDAVSLLNKSSGSILLTTGSKNLQEFTGVTDYSQRIYPRVLPLAASLQSCMDLGYRRQNIIAIQGPFSKEFNVALLKEKSIATLVTKESGAPGGFLDKVEACKETGVDLIVIRRPQEAGFSYNSLLEEIKSQWIIKKK